MTLAFITISPLPSHAPARPSISHRKVPICNKQSRAPWSLPRFLSTASFFSPLARIFSPSPDPASKVAARSKALERMAKTDKVVLVTGANGGTGRRVVKALLDDGKYVVRAVTRTRERLDTALQDQGVDVEQMEKSGKLQVFVTDLFNLRDEIFEGVVCVLGCTGVNAGPSEDPDRKKYFQGIKFYQPVILDDSPENVEFVGVGRAVKLMEKETKRRREENELQILEMGADVEKLWGGLDDVVMGGVSESFAKAESGDLVFGGTTRTENRGGFCSIRTKDFEKAIDLDGFDGLRLRIKGDGQRYKMIVRCEKKWDGLANCFSFDTVKDEWVDIYAPFEQFKPVFRGKTVENADKLNKRNIVAFQLMLSKFEYDGDLNPKFSPGRFDLRVSKMAAYKDSEVPVQFVHLGSAGVTRIFRKDELDLEKQPPAVRMNEMLGRILDWKLAGEDVVRASGLRYVIVRPCALTEKECVGIEALKIQQGDWMTGQVSRDDMARFLVDVMERKEAVGKTVEVAMVSEGETGTGGWERFNDLKKDDDVARQFAEFPYVPSALVEN